jgi:hypothetical protein
VRKRGSSLPDCQICHEVVGDLKGNASHGLTFCKLEKDLKHEEWQQQLNVSLTRHETDRQPKRMLVG